MARLRLRQLENGFIVAAGKKEFFCVDSVAARDKAKEVYMAEIAPAMAEKAANDLFKAKME